MNNKFLVFLVCFCFATYSLFAQIKEIEGKIMNDFEVENIHILNTTSRHNTITDEYGKFTINVSVHDTLYISSVKYAPQKTIISEADFERGTLDIRLQEFVNELGEVYLGSRLTGNILIDAQNITTITAPKNFERYINNSYLYKPDGQTVFEGLVSEEALNNAGLKNGLNLKSLIVLANKAIFGDAQDAAVKKQQKEIKNFKTNLKERYSVEYIEDTFVIPKNKTLEFYRFLEENGLNSELLKPGNEMDLLDFMFTSAENFTKQID